jgi:hypothetical protein
MYCTTRYRDVHFEPDNWNNFYLECIIMLFVYNAVVSIKAINKSRRWSINC